MSNKRRTPQPAQGAPARGLATLALLKANFDQGRDHIEMFMPFILDAIASCPTDSFVGDDVETQVRMLHSIRMPSHTLTTLLRRAVRRDHIRRQGGRYFREPGFVAPVDIKNRRRQFEAEHQDVARDFVRFAGAEGRPELIEDEALSLIFHFLTENHVGMLLATSPGTTTLAIGEPAGQPLAGKDGRLVARFFLDRHHNHPHIAACLRNMLEGLVLQNALFLRDIGSARRRFSNLTVFLDSGIILEAIGLRGEAAATATRETLVLLRQTGAHLSAFERTLDEIKRILRVYERHLATADGIVSLDPAFALTRHVISHRMTSSDMTEIISLLETQVGDLGIRIRPFPPRDSRYTLDEADFTHRLMGPDDTELSARVVHDVDCVAAVLTLRRGQISDSLDHSRVIFSTGSGLLVKNTREWFTEAGIPPVVHQIALSSAAWLKRPALAPLLKLHELVALCGAAVAPSKKLWNRVIAHLTKLRNKKIISSDEIVAIVANRMIEGRLSRIEDDIDTDATTLEEVIDRVRDEYREAAALQVKDVEAQFQVRLNEAERRSLNEAEQRRRLELHLIGRSQRWAKRLSWILFVLVLVIVAVGSTAWFPRLLVGTDATWKIVGHVVVAAAWVCTIVILSSGGHLTAWRGRFANLIERGLRRFFGVDAE